MRATYPRVPRVPVEDEPRARPESGRLLVMTTGPGLHEPLPLLLRRVLRGAVQEHARTERRRTFPAVLHVGMPGGAVRTFEIVPEEGLDLALRVEILEAMVRDSLAEGAVPLVWLTRMAQGADAEDAAWAAAVGHASGELGVRLDLVVVTRRAWHDPRSGAGRSWARVRPPRSDPAPTPRAGARAGG